MNKKELKAMIVKEISKESLSVNSKRVENICRSKINRMSYKLVTDDSSTYLVRGAKKVYIESNPNVFTGDGYDGKVYRVASYEASKILEKVLNHDEKIICADRPAV